LSREIEECKPLPRDRSEPVGDARVANGDGVRPVSVRRLLVAAQVQIESNILAKMKAVLYHILVSSASFQALSTWGS
jgi:hypothetical protein